MSGRFVSNFSKTQTIHPDGRSFGDLKQVLSLFPLFPINKSLKNYGSEDDQQAEKIDYKKLNWIRAIAAFYSTRTETEIVERAGSGTDQESEQDKESRIRKAGFALKLRQDVKKGLGGTGGRWDYGDPGRPGPP